MPIVAVSQIVICCIEQDALYRVTVFGNEEVLDNYDTATPMLLLGRARQGSLSASHDDTILYHLTPLKDSRR